MSTPSGHVRTCSCALSSKRSNRRSFHERYRRLSYAECLPEGLSPYEYPVRSGTAVHPIFPVVFPCRGALCTPPSVSRSEDNLFGRHGERQGRNCVCAPVKQQTAAPASTLLPGLLRIECAETEPDMPGWS